MPTFRPTLRIAFAQINSHVGDIHANLKKIKQVYARACAEKIDIVVFPELCLVGYAPEDLVLRPAFQNAAMKAIDELTQLTASSSATTGTAMIVGSLWLDGLECYNAALMLYQGKVIGKTYKHVLPNYGVFDERRVFSPGPLPRSIQFHNCKIGILICEDMWHSDVPAHYADEGVELLIAINASPFEKDKRSIRIECAQEAVTLVDAPLVYVNMVGGQDELVFDGQSFALSIDGELNFLLNAFEEDYQNLLLHHKEGCWQLGPRRPYQEEEGAALTYKALMCGLQEYVNKNHFPGIVLGLSGGIDSALCATIAVDALGAERVHCVMMPSQYTSQESLTDSQELIQKLGCRYDVIPIDSIVDQTLKQLSPLFHNHDSDTTEENMQSRIRGLILMAISNKLGSMVITTGNKSEIATGYATLYGDMCGGFAVLKDVYKTEIYTLAKWRNQQTPLIPKNIITRAPSAELRADQTDQDSLPPYDILDKILLGLIELSYSSVELIHMGYPKDAVQLAAKLLQRSEYKRFQAAPGVKISSRAFGRDWRFPLTNLFPF